MLRGDARAMPGSDRSAEEPGSTGSEAVAYRRSNVRSAAIVQLASSYVADNVAGKRVAVLQPVKSLGDDLPDLFRREPSFTGDPVERSLDFSWLGRAAECLFSEWSIGLCQQPI